MSGITGMDWPLVGELEACGYTGDVSVFGLIYDMGDDFKGLYQLPNDGNNLVRWMAEGIDGHITCAHNVDVALAQLWIKMNTQTTS